jgi:hypothetical protein
MKCMFITYIINRVSVNYDFRKFYSTPFFLLLSLLLLQWGETTSVGTGPVTEPFVHPPDGTIFTHL